MSMMTNPLILSLLRLGEGNGSDYIRGRGGFITPNTHLGFDTINNINIKPDIHDF